MMSRVIAVVVALTLAILTGVTSIQAQPAQLRIHVPYDFQMGDQSFPAGDYHLVRHIDYNDRVYRIQGVETVHAGFVVSTAEGITLVPARGGTAGVLFVLP